ncbi:rRNA maturation RNase YbeY [Peijinzhouia sedimentorum]
MEETPIHFHTEDYEFELENEERTAKWLEGIINNEKFILMELNYIFCSDEYLLKINQEYLNHDTFTDIITFDNSESEFEIEGDIFISIPRIIENAKTFETEFDQELHRVLVHGVLHLMGHGDKTEEEQQRMRKSEDYYLSLRL